MCERSKPANNNNNAVGIDNNAFRFGHEPSSSFVHSLSISLDRIQAHYMGGYMERERREIDSLRQKPNFGVFWTHRLTRRSDNKTNFISDKVHCASALGLPSWNVCDFCHCIQYPYIYIYLLLNSRHIVVRSAPSSSVSRHMCVRRKSWNLLSKYESVVSHRLLRAYHGKRATKTCVPSDPRKNFNQINQIVLWYSTAKNRGCHMLRLES